MTFKIDIFQVMPKFGNGNKKVPMLVLTKQVWNEGLSSFIDDPFSHIEIYNKTHLFNYLNKLDENVILLYKNRKHNFNSRKELNIFLKSIELNNF